MSDIIGKSFTARVSIVTEGREGPLNILFHHRPGDSGWVVRGDGSIRTMTLRFDYISHDAARHHYHISAVETGTYEGARLGVSQNGYVGLYRVAKVSDPWKIQLIWPCSVEHGFRFLLRDHQGHGLKVLPKTDYFHERPDVSPERVLDYLNVHEGAIVELQASHIRLL